MIELILGGARSGKSSLAEQLATASGLAVTYIATSQPLDEEMRQRIAHHRQRRPAHWQLVEEPLALARVLREHAAAERCLLVDCLTLWLTNLLLQEDEQRLEQERQALLEVLGELSRRYVDEAGWLHQALARRSDRVQFCVAGLPMLLKGND